MAGRISALCRRGAEKEMQSNNVPPCAMATDPTRLDVSMARTTSVDPISRFLVGLAFCMVPMIPRVTSLVLIEILHPSNRIRFAVGGGAILSAKEAGV